jgi:hypothetical protein
MLAAMLGETAVKPATVVEYFSKALRIISFIVINLLIDDANQLQAH